MFLIMSAAYVDQEMQSEFGRIPPSFLPLGNRRLFQHQVALAPKGSHVALTVPESFTVSASDKQWLESHGVEIIPVPDNITLGSSLVAAMNLSDYDQHSPLHVLFGDTLFTNLPDGNDIICVSEASDGYDWAVVTENNLNWVQDSHSDAKNNALNIVNGYFKFSSPRQLVRAITQANWDFISGLNIYHQSVGLTTVPSDSWLDFGHVNTYYRSKAHFTTQRAFNSLFICSKWIEKSSEKNSKIAAEANWFNTLPSSLRGYTPQFLGTFDNGNSISYRLEYLHQTALNELYVFGELTVGKWEQILKGCIEFLKDCLVENTSKQEAHNDLQQLFGAKTHERLQQYCQQHQISMTQPWFYNKEKAVSLQQLVDESQRHLPTNDTNEWPISVLHGDFCFSNILYDFRAEKIKVIDPRGTTPSGQHTIYGDLRYDIAKLSHSVLGMYDWIIAGCYDIEIAEQSIDFAIEETQADKVIQQRFIEIIQKEFSINAQALMAMQIQLFLSMLPLHADDEQRQKALFANAFRLYFKMKRLEE